MKTFNLIVTTVEPMFVEKLRCGTKDKLSFDLTEAKIRHTLSGLPVLCYSEEYNLRFILDGELGSLSSYESFCSFSLIGYSSSHGYEKNYGRFGIENYYYSENKLLLSDFIRVINNPIIVKSIE